jgi:hypothetical protein
MDLKVAIVVPSHADVPMQFALALAGLVGTCTCSGVGIAMVNIQGVYLPVIRTSGVKKALDLGATHVLFVDSDMSFPVDGLHRLLRADRDIIGANYVRRQAPHDSLAKAKNGKDQDISGVVEVARLPTGFMLIKTDVFKCVPQPWFATPWNDDNEQITGEDYYFCDKARSHGLLIWMDADLSASIVHWGNVGYRWTGENCERVEL